MLKSFTILLLLVAALVSFADSAHQQFWLIAGVALGTAGMAMLLIDDARGKRKQ